MRAIRGFVSTGILVLVAVLLASAGSVPSVDAASHCKKVSGVVTLVGVSGPDCPSVIGRCSAGQFKGNINGSFFFTGTSFVYTEDTPVTGVVILTGDNVVQTNRGDLFLKDAAAFRQTDASAGVSAEIDTIIGGTGDYAGATGTLQATAVFTGDSGSGSYTGELCTP